MVDAALALFAERGFDEVTVDDIAERAEVGRSTFFRYFGDKQEVIFSGHHPANLAEELAARPEAAACFEALDKTARYLMILPLLKARTPAGRAARLQKALSALSAR